MAEPLPPHRRSPLPPMCMLLLFTLWVVLVLLVFFVPKLQALREEGSRPLAVPDAIMFSISRWLVVDTGWLIVAPPLMLATIVVGVWGVIDHHKSKASIRKED